MKVSFTQAQRRAIADLDATLADRLNLRVPSARTVALTTDETKELARKAEAAISDADNGKKRNSLRHVVDACAKAIERSHGPGSIPVSERIYQFKITLIDSEPSVWRRIQVKNCSLDKLHERIQTSMGWTNSHLHQFEINGMRYGDPDLLDDGFDDFDCVDSTNTKISHILPASNARFRFLYEYDFGDDWQHEVLFEGCLKAQPGTRYPLCLEGEHACPPEDVGGVWGYAEFLEAISNPRHEQHEDYVHWAGPFDPDQFDAEEATLAMRRGLPNWRHAR